MKLNIDLSLHFWIGLAIFVCTAVSSGTIHLTNAIPEVAIPYVVAWSSIISIIGSGYLTAALGLHNASPEAKIEAVQSTPAGRNMLISATADMPEVKGIVATPSVAHDTESDKVVAKAADIPLAVPVSPVAPARAS